MDAGTESTAYAVDILLIQLTHVVAKSSPLVFSSVEFIFISVLLPSRLQASRTQ